MIEAEKELLNSPIFKNLIISEDASSTAVLINFKKDEKHELLIKERERLRNLYEPSKEDIDNLKRINLDYQISKKILMKSVIIILAK